MIDVTTIRRHYLRYWVDRSQAARKAAEELSKKEVRPSLRDLHKDDVCEELVFTLDGHKVEFKAENEKNPNSSGNDWFTYDEAVERFGEPDKDGWRLPTKEEFETLCNYSYEFKDDQGVFDNRLYLPAEGDYLYEGFGMYWSSDSENSTDALSLFFNPYETCIYSSRQNLEYAIRLVRDVK